MVVNGLELVTLSAAFLCGERVRWKASIEPRAGSVETSAERERESAEVFNKVVGNLTN
jgi:hypothetical protein